MAPPQQQSRWRAVVSSALVPAAVVFAIPGLTEHWCQYGGDFSKTKRDPALLIIGQSFGLFFNTLASFLLLFHISGFETMMFTITCIGSLAMAILLDFLCLVIFGVTPNPDGYVLSTAYYLTLASGIMSLIAAILMSIDTLTFSRTTEERTKLLTPKQRSLAMMEFHFMTYLAIGSIAYKYLLDISHLDAVYFIMTAILTVGYGDIMPRSTGSRIFSLFYFPCGIVLIAIIISLIRDTVLSSVDARIRRRILKELERSRKLERFLSVPRKGTRGSADVLNFDQCPMWEEDSNTYGASLRRAIKKDTMTDYTSEIVLTFGTFVVFWIVGTVVYMSLEGWSFFIALWFTFETYTVIGFGDYYPQTPGGRAFLVGWGVAGIVILTILFSLVSEAWAIRFSDNLRKRVVRRQVRAASDNKDLESGPVPDEAPQTPEKVEERDITIAEAEDITQDDQPLECDIERDAASESFRRDLGVFLDDCERFIGHLVKNDAPGMRECLTGILVDQDGIEDDLAWIMVTQDSDGMVGKMIMKHAQNRVVHMRRCLNAL